VTLTTTAGYYNRKTSLLATHVDSIIYTCIGHRLNAQVGR